MFKLMFKNTFNWLNNKEELANKSNNLENQLNEMKKNEDEYKINFY